MLLLDMVTARLALNATGLLLLALSECKTGMHDNRSTTRPVDLEDVLSRCLTCLNVAGWLRQTFRTQCHSAGFGMSRLLGMVIVSTSLYFSEDRQSVPGPNYIAGVEFILCLRLPHSCTVFTKFGPRVIMLRLLAPGWDHGSVLWEAYGGYKAQDCWGWGCRVSKAFFNIVVFVNLTLYVHPYCVVEWYSFAILTLLKLHGDLTFVRFVLAP